jgi:hypothetical protein
MNTDLVPAGQTVRVIPSEIGPVIPVVDIAESIGYSRGSITNAITKNEAAFRGYTSFQALKTTGGIQQFLCLNQTGIERLILLIRPAKKKGDLCERVEAFRVKAFGRMEQKKDTVPTLSSLDTELQQAKRIAELTDTDPRIMWAAALRKCGLPEYADVLRPALIRGEGGWYNPTRLVTLCNDPDLTPERLNWYLKNKGFQYRDGYIWRLTPAGLIHGREYNFEAPSGHVEVRIAWRESVLYASGLKRLMANDQTALARAA